MQYSEMIHGKPAHSGKKSPRIKNLSVNQHIISLTPKKHKNRKLLKRLRKVYSPDVKYG
jgi:hypothetical protein